MKPDSYLETRDRSRDGESWACSLGPVAYSLS